MKICAERLESDSGDCPANWTFINTACYKILIGDLNWFEAKAHCEAMDGQLVDFESEEEH